MTVISLVSEGIVLSVALRALSLATVLLVCAWALACKAGPHNAALRSFIWTTTLLLVLIIPLFSILCEYQRWAVVNLPMGWLRASGVVQGVASTRETPGVNRASEIVLLDNTIPEESHNQHLHSMEREDRLVMPREDIDSTVNSDNRRMDGFGGIDFNVASSLLIEVWAFGVAIGLLRMAIAFRRVNRLSRSAYFVNSERLDRISLLARRALRLSWPPRLSVSQEASTAAAVFCGLRGAVILPAKMLDELPDHELKDVVIHEYAHLLRFDPIVGLLQSLAAILYWPHPLIHLAKRELIRAREEVCDNYVLKETEAVAYAKALLHIAERGVMGKPLEGVASFSSNIWRLEDRIKGILDEQRIPRVVVGTRARTAVISLLGSVTILGGFARLGTAQQQKDANTPAVSQTIGYREPWHPQGVLVLGDERGRKWSPYPRTLDVHPNGGQVATADYQGGISLWNATTMRLENFLTGHDGPVFAVHYSSDGSKLFSVGEDKSIRSWDLNANERPQSAKIGSFEDKAYTTVWSADGSTFLIAQDLWRFSNSGDVNKVDKIPATNAVRTETPDDIKNLANSLNAKSILTTSSFARALSADGNQVAIASGGSMIYIETEAESVTRFEDSNVTLWRIADDKPQKRFELDQVGYVHAIAFSADGNTLAVGGQDKKTRLFDIRNDSPQLLHVLTHDAPVRGLCFDSAVSTLAVAAGSLQLWDVTRDPPSEGLNAPIAERYHFNALEMAFSQDGSTLFYVDGNSVRRWEVARTFQPLASESRPESSRVQSLGVNPNGNQLVSVIRRNGGSEIWGRAFASLAAAPKPLVTWNDNQIDNLSISKDGQRFVFAAYRDQHYTLQLWQQSPNGAMQLDSADLRTGHPGSFGCAAFSPDGQTLASGHRDGAIRVWNIDSGRLQLRATVPKVHWGGVGGLDYSPNGNTLASVDWGGSVTLWEVIGDGIRMKVVLGRHDDRSHILRFSPDGRMLATGDFKGTIRIWPVEESPTKAVNLPSHTASITSLVFAADGGTLLSSGSDGRVIIWDVNSAKPLREWRFPGAVNDARFDPTGQKVVTANGNGSIYAWDH